MGSTAPATGTGTVSTAVSSPVGAGLKAGRVDQGVDFSGSGNVQATGSGTVIHVQTSGWGSLGNAGLGALIAVQLDNPVDPSHSVVYYAENIIPNVKVGQRVSAGQAIGHATGQGGGIEIGWADPKNPTNPLAPLGKNTSAATNEGQAFASYIANGITGSAPTSTGNTDIYQTPIINPVPDISNLAAVSATQYAEQTMAPDYQKNKLLGLFGAIDTSSDRTRRRRRTSTSAGPVA